MKPTPKKITNETPAEPHTVATTTHGQLPSSSLPFDRLSPEMQAKAMQITKALEKKMPGALAQGRIFLGKRSEPETKMDAKKRAFLDVVVLPAAESLDLQGLDILKVVFTA